ncbi:MAG: methyltransferase domain-containing protein [Chloroflexia bacterium]|nr:methyltransferase domain-containing protein [Chloroflexia bacterium]
MATETKPAAQPARTTGSHGQTDFDAIADEYDESLPAHVVEHYLAKRVAFIRQYVPPGRALDIGCGTGVVAERLSREGYDVVGVDPFRGMLRYVRQRRPDLLAIAANGERLPFADNTFDLVYCIAVMHHVAAPAAVRQTLLEMTRVAKPGGHVLVWDHNPRNPYWPIIMRRVPQDTGAERLIPEREVLDGLAAGGARPVIVRPLGLMPDFTPRPLTGAVARLEHLVERVPVLNRLCAHNVVLAIKSA